VSQTSYAQGARVEDERAVRHSFVQHYSKWSYQLHRKLPLKCAVFICSSPNPPEYRDESGTSSLAYTQSLMEPVQRVCTLELDLKKLPEGAFTLYKGNKGRYFQAKFDLVLVFASTVTLKFMFGERTIKEQSWQYTPTGGGMPPLIPSGVPRAIPGRPLLAQN
jgi:hypothetical protein